jgi:hypothetical protein
VVLLALGLVTMLASGASAGEKGNGNGGAKGAVESKGKAKGKPPGNNGTVKIDGVPLKSGKGNEPHVACDFNVEFYNFDEGDQADFMATVTFELQAPTLRDGDKKDGQVLLTDQVYIGEDPAGGGGDLDASKSYNLDFTGIEAHPKQGYHVKLTVNAPGSQGADKKHKVFWVNCSTTPTTVPPTTPTTVPPTTPTTVPTTTPTTAPAVAGVAETTTTTAPTQVAGIQETRPTTLPRTGGETRALVFLAGLAMALAGVAFLGANTGRRPVLAR